MDFSTVGSFQENVVDFEIHFLKGLGPEQLELKRQELLSSALKFSRDYIWQRDAFNLHVGPAPWHAKAQRASQRSTAARSHLWGSVHFGDNIEDEWFITWFLKTCTARDSDLAVHVWDNDGSFLLIEAAEALPKWLKPDIEQNRVWLYNGELHIIPLPDMQHPSIPASPTISEALQILDAPSITTAAGKAAQDAIGARLKGFPGKARKSMHHARCVVPAAVAHVLSVDPLLIAPAVEAFYRRTPADMRAARLAKHVPPKDMVSVVLRFSRCLYAQLTQQTCEPPRSFPALPPPSSLEHQAARLGMMLTLGFEMLAASSSKHAVDTANASDTEARTKDSAAHNGAQSPAWDAFVASLQRNGYFGDDIPGSMPYRQRLSAAHAAFADMGTADSALEHPSPGARLHKLLADSFDKAEVSQAMQRDEDNEAWIAEGAAELEAQLQARSAGRPAGAGQPGVKEDDGVDAADMARRFKDFMAQLSSMEGAEVPNADLSSGDAVSMQQQKFWSELGSAFGFEGAGGGVSGGAGDDSSEEGSSFYSGGSIDSDEDEDESSPRMSHPSAAPAGTSGRQQAAAPSYADVQWGQRPSFADKEDLCLEMEDTTVLPSTSSRQTAALQNGSDRASEPFQPLMGHVPQPAAQQQSQSAQHRDIFNSAPPVTQETDSDEDDDAPGFMQQYAALLKEQLHGSTLEQSFLPLDSEAPRKQQGQQADPLEEPSDAAAASTDAISRQGHTAEQELRPLDVDLNLVQSLLASFSAQEGMPGPAGNMLGQLGMQLQQPAPKHAALDKKQP